MMNSMARRVPLGPVPIYVDSLSQQSASEECLVVRLEPKSVGQCSRRRSASLDENRKHRNRSLAEKVHSERMVCC